MGSEMRLPLQPGQGAWFSARQVVAAGMFGRRVAAVLLVGSDLRCSFWAKHAAEQLALRAQARLGSHRGALF